MTLGQALPRGSGSQARPGSGPHNWLCSPLASNRRSLWGAPSFNLSPPSTADNILLVPRAVPAERLPEAPLGPDQGAVEENRLLGTGSIQGSLKDSGASSSRGLLPSGPLPSHFLPASAPSPAPCCPVLLSWLLIRQVIVKASAEILFAFYKDLGPGDASLVNSGS